MVFLNYKLNHIILLLKILQWLLFELGIESLSNLASKAQQATPTHFSNLTHPVPFSSLPVLYSHEASICSSKQINLIEATRPLHLLSHLQMTDFHHSGLNSNVISSETPSTQPPPLYSTLILFLL